LWFALVRWANGKQIRHSPSLDGLSLHEKEKLINGLKESVRELEEASVAVGSEIQSVASRAGGEIVYLEYRNVLVTSKRLVLRPSNRTFLVSEVRNPRIESLMEQARRHSFWDSWFGPGVSLSGEWKHRDKLQITVNGKDELVDEHNYYDFSHAGEFHERQAEFDVQGLSQEDRSRKVMERHEESSAMERGSKNWATRQRQLRQVAEAIGAAIAGA